MTKVLLQKVKQMALTIGAMILLLGTFSYIFVYWALFLNARVAPWDGSSPDARPDPGTRDYMLNNFFESGPGLSIIFYGMITIIILFIILRVYWKRERFTGVILNVAAAQVIYLLSVMVVTIIIIIFFRNGEHRVGYRPVELLIEFGLLFEYLYLVYRLELVSSKLNPRKGSYQPNHGVLENIG